MSQKYKVYINNTPKIIEENWKDFCSKFIMIEAAGGLVFNKDGHILMIFRNGKWDLPKGKLEIGESVEECAKREVEEECGIYGLDIIEKLLDTYHTYKLKGNKILKKTYWYKMNTVPQATSHHRGGGGICQKRCFLARSYQNRNL